MLPAFFFFLGGGVLHSHQGVGGGVMFSILHKGSCSPNFEQGGGCHSVSALLLIAIFRVSQGWGEVPLADPGGPGALAPPPRFFF